MRSIQSIDLGNEIKVHTMNTEKFKTTTICIYIHNNINENASLNALIPPVLKNGSKNFSSSTIINEYLENMYGAVFETDIIKKGEIQSMLFYMQFISNKYAGGENILDKALGFISDIILNPIVEKDTFKPEFVNIEKNNLQERIASRINDKVQYAVEKCMEVMCENEPFSIYKYGKKEDIDNINEKNLYLHYKKVLSESPIDIFIVGDIENDDLLKSIKNRFFVDGRNPVMLNGLNINYNKKDKKVIKAKMDVNQGKLCLGFRTGISFTDRNYPALSVYTSILGGGFHSKLFQNVREKESMAYYAYSAVEKFKGLMIINCGIEVDKYDKAIELIQKQVEYMKKGDISDYEIESSIKKLRSDLNAMNDNVPLMIDYNLGNTLYGGEIEIDEMIKEIEQIEKRHIIEVAENINLDTIFFLTSQDTQ